MAIIISYPTSASGIIVLLKTPPKYRKLTHSLTHSILGAPLGEHKAPTNFFHSDRSWASHRSSFHFFSAVFISSSMVLCQVPSGLPRCLFPGGAQDSVSSGCRPFFIRRTWPSHVHRLLFASRTMLFIPVRLQISSLHTFSCHLTFNILLQSPEVCSPTSCWFSTSLRRREELNVRWTGRF